MLESQKKSGGSGASISDLNSLQDKVVSRENPPQKKVSVERSPVYLERPERYQRPDYAHFQQPGDPGWFGIGFSTPEIRDLLMNSDL